MRQQNGIAHNTIMNLHH